MQRKKVHKKRAGEVSNEEIANYLTKAGYLSKDSLEPVKFDVNDFANATRIKRMTCYKRMSVLVANGYLTKYGKKVGYKWSMNKEQKRWMIKSTRNNEFPSKVKGEVYVPKKTRKSKVVQGDKKGQYEFLHSVWFI